MSDLEMIRESLISGDIERAEELTSSALQSGISAKEILDRGLIPGLDEVGKRFQEGEYFFPELLVSGEAMKAALACLKPELAKSSSATTGKYAIGTVKGDIHDIGKNIVIMMLEGNGWEVTDLGIDVPTETFVKAVKEEGCQILGMSALLTTTIPRLAETIEELKAQGLRTKEHAEKIGADAFGKDAVDAVSEAKRLIGKL